MPDVPEPVSTMKFPSGIGAMLRRKLLATGLSDGEATRILEVPERTLSRLCAERIALSPLVASRLHRIGIDGRALFLEQASNRLRWHEQREGRR